MNDSKKRNRPELTIVGGQPAKRRRVSRDKVKVPVGLEKILFHAAREPRFKDQLLADRNGAIDGLDVRLRPSEMAVLSTVPNAALEAMIAHIVPRNPHRREFMGLVAAAAASLAAGTAATGCTGCDEGEAEPNGGGVDAGIDGDDDFDTDTDSSDNTDSDSSTEMDAGPDSGSDTDTETDTVDTEQIDSDETVGISGKTDIDGDF
jgi:hypothetical protein